MATAQTIKLLRNTTVSSDKTTALAALQTKLASMPIGEPAVNLYTVSGTTKEVLLGISAGDGNYSIYEPATEISQEIISKINALNSTKESNPSNNITITVTQENGKIKDVVLNVPSGDAIALQSDIAVSIDYEGVTDYPEVEGVTFTPVKAEDNLDTAFKSVDQNVATLANEVIKNEEVTTASFVKVREALELSDGLEYKSNADSNYISGATSFADADNKLDGAIKSVDQNVTALTNEVIKNEEAITASFVKVRDALELSNGLEYESNADSNYISGATSFADADNKLDSAIKSVDQNVTALTNEVIKNEEAITASFVKVRDALELSNGLEYESNTGSNYISGATSFADADNKLDGAIKTISDSLNGITGNNPITITDSGGTKVISLTFDGVTLIVKDGKLCVNTLDCGVYQ